MSPRLFVQLGLAGILLFLGVSLSLKPRPRLESPIALVTRLAAIFAAAALFLLYIAESLGIVLSLDRAFHWFAIRARRLVQTWISLF
jgi:hypothetical protein